MKRIITLMLCAAVLLSVAVTAVSSAGTLIHSDNFDNGFPPRNWIQGAFSWDKENGTIYGYNDAVVLQSQFNAPYNKKWADFYASVDFQIKADDDRGDGQPTHVGLWYCDTFTNEADTNGAVYEFRVCIQTGEAVLTKTDSFTYKDENGINQSHTISDVVIAGPTKVSVEKIEVGENAPFYNIGFRIGDGIIQCYFEEELVFDLAYDPNDVKIGDISQTGVDATLGSMESPVLLLNGGNWIVFDNFEVWDVDYDFGPDVIYGDADGNGAVNLLDASAMMKFAAGWSDVTISEDAADVDGSGKVNLVDVGLVMKAIAKWDVVLGPQA